MAMSTTAEPELALERRPPGEGIDGVEAPATRRGERGVGVVVDGHAGRQDRAVDVEAHRAARIHEQLVGFSVPAFGGAWTVTWSSDVSMSNSVVAVFGSTSLLV
jgi:hypothetical protein